MGREYLASKITSGRTTANPKATWWFRHCQSIVRYLVFTGFPDSKGIDEVRAEALALAEEWDHRMPSSFPKGAMGRHVTLELGIVDAVRRKDPKTVETIGDLLVEDVSRQVDQLGTLDPSMPKDRLKRLVDEHVVHFMERVRCDIEKTETDACNQKAEANTMALVDFTLEWF